MWVSIPFIQITSQWRSSFLAFLIIVNYPKDTLLINLNLVTKCMLTCPCSMFFHIIHEAPVNGSVFILLCTHKVYQLWYYLKSTWSTSCFSGA